MVFFGIFQFGPINDEQQGPKIELFGNCHFEKSLHFFWGKLELPGFFRLSSFITYRIKKDRTKSIELEDTYVAPKNAGQGPRMNIFLFGRDFEREFVARSR